MNVADQIVGSGFSSTELRNRANVTYQSTNNIKQQFTLRVRCVRRAFIRLLAAPPPEKTHCKSSF